MRNEREGLSLTHRIHRIVAGWSGGDQDQYAEAFLKGGVVAVGWGRVGDVSNMKGDEIKRRAAGPDWSGQEAKNVLLRFRDSISIGDPVIAYKSPNCVVAVGRVTGRYYYDKSDQLGSLRGLRFPHKRKVRWREKPRMFDRRFLPADLSSRLAARGTLTSFDYDYGKLNRELDGIPGAAGLIDIRDEEQIRAYFKHNIRKLHRGFVAVDERSTSVGPVHILAKCGDFCVVIEVKRNASDAAVGQLLRYMAAIRREKKTSKVRGVIIAEGIPEHVRQTVRGLNISVYACQASLEIKRVL